MSDQEAFITDVDTALLFFRFCQRFHVEGREERLALIRLITSRHRDKVKYVRDIKPHLAGKKILVVKPPKENKNDDRTKS